MKQLFFISIITLAFIACDGKKGSFIESVQSQNDFKTTITKLETLIKDKGLIHFETLDHSQNARDIKMDLKPESVVVFGNPKMGTVLMQCNPSIGLDLPLRILVNTSYEGITTLSYTNPELWSLKHNVKSPSCLEVLKKAKIALRNLADEAAQKE